MLSKTFDVQAVWWTVRRTALSILQDSSVWYSIVLAVIIQILIQLLCHKEMKCQTYIKLWYNLWINDISICYYYHKQQFFKNGAYQHAHIIYTWMKSYSAKLCASIYILIFAKYSKHSQHSFLLLSLTLHMFTWIIRWSFTTSTNYDLTALNLKNINYKCTIITNAKTLSVISEVIAYLRTRASFPATSSILCLLETTLCLARMLITTSTTLI